METHPKSGSTDQHTVAFTARSCAIATGSRSSCSAVGYSEGRRKPDTATVGHINKPSVCSFLIVLTDKLHR